VYLGIDVGTSSVKAVLVDDNGAIVGQSSAALLVSRPQPGFSEQDPQSWWHATVSAVKGLPKDLRAAVRAVGLSGQMHGATLLDDRDRPLRPAILWNDGRSALECAELERREPLTRAITGNITMPGFTAPKLLWVAKHEPALFERTAHVLLPKDFVRLQLTGWMSVGATGLTPCWRQPDSPERTCRAWWKAASLPDPLRPQLRTNCR
jgi:xylulokinase